MSDSYASRDATSLKILGSFFVILGALVLCGSLWSLGDTAKVVVNLACGAALAGIGGLMLVFSRRFQNSAAAEANETE